MGKFLAKRGPGLHHVAYQVSDIDAALQELAGAGFELIDKTARVGIGGARVAFLEPKSTRAACSSRSSSRLHGRRARGRLHRRGGGALMAAAPRRVSVGFQGGQVLALRVSDEQLRRCTRRSARAAGTSWRPRTGPCASTSRRWCMCGSRGTTRA